MNLTEVCPRVSKSDDEKDQETLPGQQHLFCIAPLGDAQLVYLNPIYARYYFNTSFSDFFLYSLLFLWIQ